MNDLLPMINCHWVAKFQIAPGGNGTLFYVVTRNSKSTINASSSTGDFASYGLIIIVLVRSYLQYTCT